MLRSRHRNKNKIHVSILSSLPAPHRTRARRKTAKIIKVQGHHWPRLTAEPKKLRLNDDSLSRRFVSPKNSRPINSCCAVKIKKLAYEISDFSASFTYIPAAWRQYSQSMKKIEGHFCISSHPSHPIPSHQSVNTASRASLCQLELDSEGTL